MNTIDYLTADSMPSILASLERFAEAGIDPAFDSECEELERQFAEYRLTNERN